MTRKKKDKKIQKKWKQQENNRQEYKTKIKMNHDKRMAEI